MTGFNPAGGMPLVLLQAFWIAALFSGFGALLFHVLLAPPTLARAGDAEAIVDRRCRLLARLGLSLALILGIAWLFGETAMIAGATSAGATLAALPVVLTATQFGHFLTAQLAAVVAALFLSRHTAIAMVVAGAATALQAWHLHAAAMADEAISLLLVASAVHMLAAAAWLGSLLPLALLVGCVPAEAGFLACHRYGQFGGTCVLLLAVTALWQGLAMSGGLHAVLTTAYGHMMLVKLLLFAVLLGFAWRHHSRLGPRLATDADGTASRLMRSIFLEAGFGLMIVLAAATLASLPPGGMTM
jgi:copper resistance protein D